MTMNIIGKQFVTINNHTYFLLGVDAKNQKYYIRHVNAVNKIGRLDFIYIIEDDNLVDAISYNLYFNNLDKITHSTLTTEELDDLKDSLDYISNLNNAYKIVMHSNHGIFANTFEPSEDVIRQHEIDLMQYYPQINAHFTKEK